MIKKQTFDNNLKEQFKFRSFHKKQLDFFNQALKQINIDRDTNRLTVFSARCGLGKSTFLQILIKSWLTDNENRGLIIVTDNLKRLKEFNDESDKRIAYLTAENKSTEIVRQANCPVLLMSTQRYFQMVSIEPFLTYYENGNKYNRDTIIFDESPYFRDITEIGIKELDILHSALNGGITDLCNASDKKWAITQYDLFRAKMIDIINGLEQQRNFTTYLYYQPCCEHLTEDDERFLRIIANSSNEIKNKYPTALKILDGIRELLKNGGFFVSSKLHDSNTYNKGFILCQNTKDKFLLGRGVKTFIFDATSNISEFYPSDAEWITMLDCGEFNVPLDYMNVHLVNINTSRNALLNQADKEAKINSIKKYIHKLSIDVEDTLFISYKPLIEDGVFDDIGFNSSNSMYFGNTKGFNNNNDKHTFIQVGLNRQSDINYLMMLLENNEDYSMRIKYDTVFDIETNIKEVDNLLKSDLVDGYMAAEVIADFIQNVFRTKAREIKNRDTIDVYLFCRNTENIMTELNYSLGKSNAHIDVIELEDIQENKIKNRKGDSVAKRIIIWLEKQEKERVFTVKELLAEVGIEANNFKVAKRKNNYLSSLFDSMKIGKGVYKII